MAIYRKRINGRKVWWVRVNYRGLNASRICESKEVAKDAETELRGKSSARSSTLSSPGCSRPHSRRYLKLTSRIW